MKRNIYIVLRILGIACLFLMAAAYFAGSTVVVQQQERQMICHRVHIQIVDSATTQLVQPQDVFDFLNSKKISLIGQELKKIDLYGLEQIINQEDGVKKCEIFTQPDGQLTIRVFQRNPLLHLQSPRGGYYIDDDGALFPAIAQRTAPVPVVSGSVPIKDSVWMGVLYDFGRYLRNHRFWREQIDQLLIHDLNNIEIHHRAAPHTTIMMGDLSRFEYKMQKLYTFHYTVAATEGWERFGRVDLRFGDQVVCRKN